MKNESLSALLRQRFAAAIAAVGGSPAPADSPVRASTDPKFGDYQCNAAMALAKPLGVKPREAADRIVAAVSESLREIAEPLEVAGPGFINIRLRNEFLAARLAEIPPAGETADRLGVPPAVPAQRIVIDYSSPNIAKQMHVGHLRGTILGDCLARTLLFAGHEVIRQNHLGDWGTQFGKLIAWYADHAIPIGQDGDALLEAMEEDYRKANKRFDEDAAFATAARTAVGSLQSGDPAARQVWQRIYRESQRAFNEIYALLGALLTDADIRGESFYNDLLAPTIDELRHRFPPRDPVQAQSGPRLEVREDQGALCVFLYGADGRPRYKNADGGEFPMIVQKTDGAFLYSSTDLAALRFRMTELKADRVIYVVGNEQAQHLQMLFEAGRLAGWVAPHVQLNHAGHGLVLGETGKKLTGRQGGSVHLHELLDEAVQRARAVVDEIEQRRDPETTLALDDSEKSSVARHVGIGALKYADLAHDRNTDYRFSWSKLLAMDGNTAPYLMYAYARVRSIYRKAMDKFGIAAEESADAPISIAAPAERTLALHLLRFRDTLNHVAEELAPHALCSYLYELAGHFMRFYEACPVLQAPDDATRLSRMRLADLTARTLNVGLSLLGIQVVERM
jgi:arginyl-tRNA synthetase